VELLDITASVRHTPALADAAHPLPDIDDDEAEVAALKAAIAKCRADPREVPHEEMRAWLLKIAEGDFSAPPPTPRLP
jgi:hypothetical protein